MATVKRRIIQSKIAPARVKTAKVEKPRRKIGRPREYDPAIMAEEMLEWSKDEDSINIAQFCADRGYLPGLIWRIEKENEEFSNAYAIARLRLAERRERLMNNGLLNYGAWQRYQRGYDAFLSRVESDQEERDAARRRGIAQSEQANLFMLAKLAAEGKISQEN